jgi:predicted Zn-dependent peptidase
LIGGIKLELESSDSFANFYGGQMILRKDVKTIKDIEKKIQEVSLKDIHVIAHKIFIPKGLNIALIGDGLNEKQIKQTVNL